ncbi:MAG: glycosyltransferase family 39 protein [Gammaproteobacteria bacterium]|nr:glycosyltransferase family 39 protein [Gammaproteobacteria bacterium]
MKGILAILLIVITGSLLRFNSLDDRPMTHPEFYAPGLEIPEYVWTPNERTTISEVIAAPYTIHHPHLPAHDLLLLGWTHLFGTDLFSLRASSALTGILTLLALYLFARETSNRRTALLSAAILAVHGYHVYWSQLAKQWVLLSLLGVLSAYLLARLSSRWNAGAALMYAGVCISGLWVDSYFWPIFLTQILWVLFNDAQNKRPSLLLNVQFISLLLAYPALAYLLHFSDLNSHLPPDIWPRFLEMMQFGGIIIRESTISTAGPINLLIGIFGALLVVIGLVQPGNGHAYTHVSKPAAEKLVRLFMGVSVLTAPAFSFLLFRNDSLIQHNRSFYIGSLLPLLMVVCWLFLNWQWQRTTLLINKISKNRLVRNVFSDLPATMMILPFLLLSIIHLKKPVLTPYALISLTPFFILIASRGIFRLGRTLQYVAGTGILAVCVYSVYQSAHIENPRDYAALANVLEPEIRDGDLLLIDDKWYLTPVIYYFPPSRYELRPTVALSRENLLESTHNSNAGYKRFWLVDFQLSDAPNRYDLPASLKEVKRVRANNGIAILFESDAPLHVPPDQRSYRKPSVKEQ